MPDSQLLTLQKKFSKMIAELILWAYEHGYEITLGEGYDDDGIGHKKGSNHYIKLAQDLNVFKGGVYLKHGEDYTDLGEEWERMGGTWGGRFQDGNHFSLQFNGSK